MAEKSNSILFLGKTPANFTNTIAKQAIDLDFKTGLAHEILPKSTNRLHEIQTAYNQVHQLPSIDLAQIAKYKLFFSLFSNRFWYFLCKHLNGSNLYNSLIDSLRFSLFSKRIEKIISQYDIINLQQINSLTCFCIPLIKKEQKVVASFWGSDLMRGNPSLYFKQLKVVKRADIITVHSHEMREVLLAKFGREFLSKIRLTLFGTSPEFFKVCDNIQDWKNFTEESKKSFNIPKKKLVITIGHSAMPLCNHLPILEQLSSISSKTKERIHLILPLTYGREEKYISKVVSKAKETNISHTVLHEYLTMMDIVKIRKTSDVIVYLLSSDAFGLSLCESIYLNNIPIVGAWLPYKKLNQEKIYNEELFNLNSIGSIIENIAKQPEEFKRRCKNNPQRVRKILSPNENAKEWIKIFEEWR